MVQSKIPMIHIQFEELFREKKMIEITQFMGLTYNKEITGELNNKVDQYHHQMQYIVNENILNNHPDIIELLRKLNY